MYQNIGKVNVLKCVLNDDDIEKMIKNQHTWMMGLFPPRSFQIEKHSDIFVPYIVTAVCYYKNINKRRRCYVFSNLELNIKSGVESIDNLEFVDMDLPSGVAPINIDVDDHSAEIVSYCKLDLLVKNYRKHINWNIEILEIKRIYRIKRRIVYSVNGQRKIKDIFLDNMILK